MIKGVLILGLVAVASAQVLRISPAVIGSSSAGQVQVIQLARGGGLGAGGGGLRGSLYQAAPRPTTVARIQPISSNFASTLRPVQIVQAAPQPQIQLVRLVQAAPQPAIVRLAAPQLAAPQRISFAQPARSSYREADDSNSQPAPYAFSFDSEDEYGTKLGRQEQADGSGAVKGQYTLSDANGISRIVVYVADDNGFRAEVKTNEPGTLTSNPADVQIQSSAGGR